MNIADQFAKVVAMIGSVAILARRQDGAAEHFAHYAAGTSRAGARRAGAGPGTGKPETVGTVQRRRAERSGYHGGLYDLYRKRSCRRSTANLKRHNAFRLPKPRLARGFLLPHFLVVSCYSVKKSGRLRSLYRAWSEDFYIAATFSVDGWPRQPAPL